MKVATSLISFYYLAIQDDGTEFRVFQSSEMGYSNAKRALQYKFGIETSESTIFNGGKCFTPTKFPYLEKKEHCLAYLNWSINEKNKDGKFFVDFPLETYTNNNPIIDVKLCVVVKK